MLRIALVTAAEAEELDEDLEPLSNAIRNTGHDVSIARWDDATIEWSAFDAAVLRSTWDYPERLDEFLDWVERCASRTLLLNPPPIVRWNTDKRYIGDLAAAGVQTVPTTFVGPGDSIGWPAADEIVVKPSVSAGARTTARLGSRTAAVDLVEAIWSSGRTAMIQPYLDSIEASGELGLVFFDAEFSHAFRKQPLLELDRPPTPDLFAEEEIGAATAGSQERSLALSALQTATDLTGIVPTYGRVDVVETEDGPVVLELELVEPSVYHATAPESAQRFANSIARAISG